MSTTPEVLWAQRSNKTEAEKNVIYLTISVPDVKEPKIEVKSQSLTFSGHSESLKRDYAITLDFYAEIDESASKYHHTLKSTKFVLRKKELKEEFWPRLLKDSKKVHYLKTDFDKWVDEDEQDEAPEEDMSQMGGMGGMPGMGDMMGGAGGDFNGIDFSKLGAGMGGFGGEEEEGEDDEDEDELMPALEGEEEAAEEAAEEPKAKITEVA
ncbi:p23 chaperone protein wos2 [Ciborinia camelliae]|nr:p23 chaperone protein wos2 [Ciborinia camelliae]